MNLSTNLIDIWPAYGNSDKTVQLGDRVLLMKGLECKEGILNAILFEFTNSGDLSDPIELANVYMRIYQDDPPDFFSYQNPEIYL